MRSIFWGFFLILLGGATAQSAGDWTCASLEDTGPGGTCPDCLKACSLLAVLRQLRDAFPDRPQGAPWSVILCGLRDVREYKRASGGDAERLGTASPFNIKIASFTLTQFTPQEVRQLLEQHTTETGQPFEPAAFARVHELTCGQPWLVNALVREVIEPPMAITGTITAEHINEAKERLIEARATHLDSLVARLAEPRVRVLEPILAGEMPPLDTVFDDDVLYVRDLGLVADKPLRPANPIYAEIIARVLSNPCAPTAASTWTSCSKSSPASGSMLTCPRERLPDFVMPLVLPSWILISLSAAPALEAARTGTLTESATRAPTAAELRYGWEHLDLCPTGAQAWFNPDRTLKQALVTAKGPCVGLHHARISWNEAYQRAGRPDLVTEPLISREASTILAMGGVSAFLYGGLIAVAGFTSDQDERYGVPGLLLAGVGAAVVTAAIALWPGDERTAPAIEPAVLTEKANQRLRAQLDLPQDPRHLPHNPVATASQAVAHQRLEVINYRTLTTPRWTSRNYTGPRELASFGVAQGKKAEMIPWDHYAQLTGRTTPPQSGFEAPTPLVTTLVVLGGSSLIPATLGTRSEDPTVTYLSAGVGIASLVSGVALWVLAGPPSEQASLQAETEAFNRRLVERHLGTPHP